MDGRVIGNALLIYPHCSSDVTHVEHVFVSARQEDRLANEITVNAISGRVETRNKGEAPIGSTVGHGRRQRIALGGYCDLCGTRFALVITQHKGSALVEWAEREIPLWNDEDPLDTVEDSF
ncbi:hypothetical protein FHR81_003037 [Actinoalloteichus hoggarensis]|uniref:Uncharacterized protein n=1 Tax=Actinoalloteichus hoggarensis TaxID=1470176 RepID=A0A221VYM6_9PSEU|nr:hypothetical protein [Actinoalloteichus hoggarensis]ASO18630.1 hypothetical protein AHOG_04885 [Actinoalloteichus hoggarensis]MBB5921997.1 hypothetical protein [Actinoalloteichus hoggarensis]